MKILVDSDCLVGAFRLGDPHYEKAKTLLKSHHLKENQLNVLNIVLQETVTVLSHRVGMNAVRLFLNEFPKIGLHIIRLESDLEDLSWKFFLQQTKKGSSFVDCANLAAIEYYKLDGVLSFDKFYPAKLLVRE